MQPHTPTLPPPPRRNGPSLSCGLSCLVMSGLLLLVGYLAGVLWGNWPDIFNHAARPPLPEARAVTPRGDLADHEKTAIEIYKNNLPSVVHVSAVSLHRDRFSMNSHEIPRGMGTGFVWDDRGHIVTNLHVVDDVLASPGKVLVTLSDRSVWDGELVGTAKHQDLAVFKISAPAHVLRPLPLGSSAKLQIGQSVFAIGDPFGLSQTLTTGVISGLDREIKSVSSRTIRGVIQTDAAINPGNSGGPLIDSAGRLIGVNTAIYSPSGTYAGVGFAIPVDTVNRIVPQLLQFKRVKSPGLGIAPAQDVTMRQIGLEGVMVMRVSPDSAAERAGLRGLIREDDGLVLGDIITELDGTKIKRLDDLFSVLDRHKVGDTINGVILRAADSEESEEIDFTVTLQEIE